MTPSADDELREVGSYALRLANLGYDAPMIERTLLQHPAILDVQAKRGGARAKGAAQRKAAWAVEYAAQNPVSEWRSRIPARIVGYREAADDRPWTGRTGPTDRRVLEAFYLTATFANSTKFRFAARTIGGRTGMSWRTASEATRRLLDHRLIRKVGNYGEGLGTKYQLAAPIAWNLHNRSSPPAPIVPGLGTRSPGDPLVQEVLKHEAFGNLALGDAGWMVVHWLHDLEPARPRQLSTATGIHYDRVRRVLGRLHRAEIAHPVPDGWVRVSDVELVPGLDAFVAGVGSKDADLLFVQERGIPDWWSTWWGSLSEKAVPHAA